LPRHLDIRVAVAIAMERPIGFPPIRTGGM
jgi:hypothetical protein